MTELLASLLVNLTEYWIFLLLMQCVCSAHLHFDRKNIVLCSLISLLSTLLSAFLETFSILPYTSLFCMPLAIFMAVLLCSFRRTDFFLYIPALALYFILAFIPEKILLILLPSLQAHFLLPEHHLSVTAVLSDLLLLAFLLLLRHILTKYRIAVHFSLKEAFGSIGLVFFSLIDVMLLLSLDRTHMTAHMYYIWVCIFIGMLLFGIGYYLYNLLDARVRIYHRHNAENEINYLKLQVEALSDLKENAAQVQKLRHDLSNHLSVIEALCAEGNYDEIKRYTGQLHEGITLSGGSLLSGNQTADFILRSKAKLAKDLGIEFTLDGSFDRLEYMNPPDLCSLLANAYDNALEACKNAENPYIRTTVKNTRNYTCIRIVNSTTKKISIQGSRIPTTKKEKNSHGYGTKIMKEIAEKYNGSCTFSCEEQEFRVKIILLNKKQDTEK